MDSQQPPPTDVPLHQPCPGPRESLVVPAHRPASATTRPGREQGGDASDAFDLVDGLDALDASDALDAADACGAATAGALWPHATAPAPA
jgi:hypothetical protein